MTHLSLRHLLAIILAAQPLMLAACGPDGSDEEPTPEPEPELPSVIPNDWFTGIEGSILNRKEFLSGALEDEVCTETLELTGLNVTDVLPENCPTCDISYNIYTAMMAGTDCPGGDDIDDEGKMAFDLRQESGEAVLYWFNESWWSSEWIEIGTGTITRDDEALVFNFHFEWNDPDNDEWAGNFTTEDPCGWWDERCTWNGYYTADVAISFDWLDEDGSPAP